MKIEELQEYAMTLGILSAEKFTDTKELIHTIQLADGREDCFCSTAGCHSTKYRCEWESECCNRDGNAIESHSENIFMEGFVGNESDFLEAIRKVYRILRSSPVDEKPK